MNWSNFQSFDSHRLPGNSWYIVVAREGEDPSILWNDWRYLVLARLLTDFFLVGFTSPAVTALCKPLIPGWRSPCTWMSRGNNGEKSTNRHSPTNPCTNKTNLSMHMATHFWSLLPILEPGDVMHFLKHLSVTWWCAFNDPLMTNMVMTCQLVTFELLLTLTRSSCMLARATCCCTVCITSSLKNKFQQSFKLIFFFLFLLDC